MNNLFDYKFALSEVPDHTASAMEYLVDLEKVCVRAVKPGLSALIPVSYHEQQLKGLSTKLEPQVALDPLVPESMLLEMWSKSAAAYPNEILFHLVLNNQQWELVVPQQIQSPNECTDLNSASSHTALIEVHSHGASGAYFSAIDDDKDQSRFRITGVIGKVRSSIPELIFRVCVFGHGLIIPASTVFERGEGSSFLRDRTDEAKEKHHPIQPLAVTQAKETVFSLQESLQELREFSLDLAAEALPGWIRAYYRL